MNRGEGKKFHFIFIFVVCFFLPGSSGMVRATDKPVILVPATPSSIPVILAAEGFGEIKVVHSLAQAHASFIRGDADFVLTGLSVGLKFYDQGMPVRIVASHVSGISYLLYNKQRVAKADSFIDLQGKKIWFPFPGAPLEEVSRYLAGREKLELGKDIDIGYGGFQSNVKLLKAGKIDAVALPEPFVTLALKNSQNVRLGFGLAQLYREYNSSSYPQVALITKSNWILEHREQLSLFYENLEEAIKLCQNKPEEAVIKVKGHFTTLSEDILLKALTRTEFFLLREEKLQQSILEYYQIIGKELSSGHREFFKINP